MAKILQFPTRISLAPIRVRSGRHHHVSVRIVDQQRSEEARWHLQFAIQRAASLSALKDFTDVAARRREWHDFAVGRTFLLRRFIRDIEALILADRVTVLVDELRVRAGHRRVA